MIQIIDNGSQYTHMIKRICKRIGGVHLVGPKGPFLENPEFMIISGGPGSVNSENTGKNLEEYIRKNAGRFPMLGVCYGHQLIAKAFGGRVGRGFSGSYGHTIIKIVKPDTIFKGIPERITVWSSHFDEVKSVPEGFEILATSENCRCEAMASEEKKIFSVQFHPEVWHTEYGKKIYANFFGKDEAGF